MAGPIWGEAMDAIADKLTYEDFQVPPGDEIAGVLTAVPDVAGMTLKDARAALEAAGFATTLAGYTNSEIPADSVAGTSPAAGTQLGSGDTIAIYQSTGVVPAPPPEDGGEGNKGRGNGKGRGNR